MGYRFAVRSVDYPSSAHPGDRLHLSLWIENRGVAPIYHRYPFVLRLRGKKGTFDFETNADITSWLPGDVIWNGFITLPEEVPPGEYILEAGIHRGNEIIYLATDSPETDGFSQITDTIFIAPGDR